MEDNEKLPLNFEYIPKDPGVYRYYDKDGHLLYVGKAKNLRKRVASYFGKNHDQARMRLLVRKINRIETIVVNSEYDALLLENNLIKEHQPPFNIQLKDDKTYPWICITEGPFPRIIVTRNKLENKGTYFGPYASVTAMRQVLNFIREMYPLRTCTLELNPANIQKKRFRVCLDFHIGTCKGPCEGKQSEMEYMENIGQVKSLLKGNISEILKEYKRKMNDYASDLKFEKAQVFKEKIQNLEKYQSKSVVASNLLGNLDVVAISGFGNLYFVNYFVVKEGRIIASQILELKRKLEETEAQILMYGIIELRTKLESQSPVMLLPFLPEIMIPGLEFFVPKAGEKKMLLNLCMKNAVQYRINRAKQIALQNPEEHTMQLMEKMKKDLRMTNYPKRIECFDNSNLHGTFPVSAMSVFINGKAAKKEYRHFNVKTVVGSDDFATMEEVIYRRYLRVKEEGLPLPDLIVIDGGKGQLHSAINSLSRLGLEKKIAVIGIAKRLEEIFFAGDPIPLYLDKRSETLRVIQQIRDEVHRFGIEHHRKRRLKGGLQSELQGIPGISDKTIEKLLREFSSVKGVQSASKQDLITVCGEAKAKLLLNFFESKTQ